MVTKEVIDSLRNLQEKDLDPTNQANIKHVTDILKAVPKNHEDNPDYDKRNQRMREYRQELQLDTKKLKSHDQKIVAKYYYDLIKKIPADCPTLKKIVMLALSKNNQPGLSALQKKVQPYMPEINDYDNGQISADELSKLIKKINDPLKNLLSKQPIPLDFDKLVKSLQNDFKKFQPKSEHIESKSKHS